ncbi:MAG: GAF domain-containing protein, partial [Chloroflexota bacterium]
METKPKTPRKQKRVGSPKPASGRRVKAFAAVQETVFDIVTRHSMPQLLNVIVERAATLLHASSGGMYLAEPEKRVVRCMVSYNTKEDYRGAELAYGEGAAGWVAETGQPLMVDDYRKWPGRAKMFEKKRPFQALISAPMLWQGRVNGVIHI